MHITLNGEPHELPDGTTLQELVSRLYPGGGRIAVEVNREIVPRSVHGATSLKPGDVVEIVHAIGGG